MGGYCYGEPEPVEDCPCCGGEAFAEYCDVGVGMVQIEPFRCSVCGAIESMQNPGWEVPPKPSELGQEVTGYFINEKGYVFETTFRNGHAELFAAMKSSWPAQRAKGCVRITCLEGYAIDLPPFMTDATRRALSKTLKEIGERWGLAYVVEAGEIFGGMRTRSRIMSIVSRLPREPESSPLMSP